MEIVIDLIVVSFILLCVFFGYKKGLVKLGIRMVSFLIAIIITFVLYKPISMIIINYTQIDETIQNIMVEKLDTQNSTEEKGIDGNIIENTKDSILSEIAKPLSYNIIYGGVMILLFLISKIVMFCISSLSDIVTELPIINQFNKAGGILYGILIGFFIIYAILLIISFIVECNSDSQIYHLIENTYVTKILYDYNIFHIFLM